MIINPWIQNVIHFIFLFTFDFNRWKGIMNSSWIGRCMVRFPEGNTKHNMEYFHKLINLSWKTTTLICLQMKNGPSLWWSNFLDSLVILICCHWSQTWSSTLKLGCFFQCSSTFSLYCLCVFSKLNRSWTRTFINHMAWSSIVRFMTLFKHWMSNLGCKPWFAFFLMFVDLMNALCCYRQFCHG